ncbi:MAG: hypothetical protein FJ087_12200 [Deltaproteobacteria bacterium]|nr:hypothetical protein [Deltaproteobacteria bacterium]
METKPRTPRFRRIRIPIGIEKVLVRAAGDARFRAALLRDRAAAIEAAGYEMLPSELTVIASVSEGALETMIGRIDVRRHGTGRFMRGVAAAALASAAATSSLSCDSSAREEVRAGVPADVEVLPIDAGHSPEVFQTEIRLDAAGELADMPDLKDVWNDPHTAENEAPEIDEPGDPQDVAAPEFMVGGIMPDEPEADVPARRPGGQRQ